MRSLRTTCTTCGVGLLGDVDDGSDDGAFSSWKIGRRCSACGAAYCKKHVKRLSAIRKSCPNCGGKGTFSQVLRAAEPEPAEGEDATCVRCGNRVPIGQFAPHSVAWGEPDHVKSGCRCLACGAMFCHREAFDVGALAGVWSNIPCPQCGVRGSMGAIAVVPDRYREAAKTLHALHDIESDVDRRRVQRRLGDHGDTAVEILLADELLEGFIISMNPMYLAMIAEVGKVDLIDDTVIEWLIGRLDDPDTDPTRLDNPGIDPKDRLRVYQSLARIAAVTGDDAAVKTLLTGLAEEEQPWARTAIAVYIGAIDDPRVDSALEAARSDKESFPRSSVDELMPTAGQWFMRTLFNPFQVGVKQFYTVGEIATMCLRARKEPDTSGPASRIGGDS